MKRQSQLEEMIDKKLEVGDCGDSGLVVVGIPDVAQAIAQDEAKMMKEVMSVYEKYKSIKEGASVNDYIHDMWQAIKSLAKQYED